MRRKLSKDDAIHRFSSEDIREETDKINRLEDEIDEINSSICSKVLTDLESKMYSLEKSFAKGDISKSEYEKKANYTKNKYIFKLTMLDKEVRQRQNKILDTYRLIQYKKSNLERARHISIDNF